MYDFSDTEVPWYSYADSVKTVLIGEGVTSIGKNAFCYCKQLESITIPDGVTSIGYAAFSACTKLKAIEIPESVTSIGAYAFRVCNSLTSVTIPDGVNSIGMGTFSNCEGLTEVTLSESVTSIGINAFYECPALKTVTIFDSVTSIKSGAFSGCSELKTVHYIGTSDEWNEITIETKNDCLTDVQIHCLSIADNDANCTVPGYTNAAYCVECKIFPVGEMETAALGHDWLDGVCRRENCGEICEHEFADGVCGICSMYGGKCGDNLVWQLYSDDVLSISGEGTMYDYSFGTSPWYSYRDSVKSVVIADGITNIGMYAFCNCTALETVTISDSVSDIGYSAFMNCTGLTSMTIPDGVAYIGSGAFENCNSITTITISSSVTDIDSYAFFNCTSLTHVYYTGISDMWNEIAIGKKGNDSLINAVIYCLRGSGTAEGTTDDNICDHLCHSSNKFMQFIWKLISFFYRIFGANQYCDCGEAHY